MHTRIITALLDSHGPDITGRDVPMPAGSQHEVSEYNLGYFRDHPDVFSIGDAHQTKADALANELAAMGIKSSGGRAATVHWNDLPAPTTDNLGAVYLVDDIAPTPFEVCNSGFGWRPTSTINFPGLAEPVESYDFVNTQQTMWSITLPASFAGLGCLILTPMVVFPSSASTKVIKVLVNGQSFWFKSRTTTTHEGPLIVLDFYNGDKVESQYNTNLTYGSGQSGYLYGGALLNTETNDLKIELTAKFGAAGTNTEKIALRYIGAEFRPF